VTTRNRIAEAASESELAVRRPWVANASTALVALGALLVLLAIIRLF